MRETPSGMDGVLSVLSELSDRLDRIERQLSHASGGMPEPWLDKKELSEHLSCGVRSIEYAQEAGMPHAMIFGKVKFKVSEAEPWLEAAGHPERHEGESTYDGPTKWTGGAATPRSRTRGGFPHASKAA